MNNRTFPAPWRVEETTGGHYVVRDANGFRLAYVYGHEEQAMQRDHLTAAEARKIAQLPELWRKQA